MSDIEPTIGWPAHCASIMTKLSEMEVRAITAEQEAAELQTQLKIAYARLNMMAGFFAKMGLTLGKAYLTALRDLNYETPDRS